MQQRERDTIPSTQTKHLLLSRLGIIKIKILVVWCLGVSDKGQVNTWEAWAVS